MVLRLVLVGIVAGLGISPPAESELSGWTRSVQSWLDDRLAHWDARGPLDADEWAFESVTEAPSANEAATNVHARDAEEDALTVSGPDAVLDERVAEFLDGPATGEPAPIEDKKAAEAAAFDAVVDEMIAEFSTVDFASRAPAEATPALPTDR